jgi:hypothetical protein
VYGTVGPANSGGTPTSSYTVDGGSPVRFTAGPADGAQYRTLFFQSPSLSPTTPHSLTVELLNDDAVLFIDFLVVTPSANTRDTTGGSSSAPTSSTATTGSTSALPGGPSSHQSHVSSRMSTAAIVGPVVGGVFAVLLLAVIGFICWRKRRRGRAQEGREKQSYLEAGSSSKCSGILRSMSPMRFSGVATHLLSFSHPQTGATGYSSTAVHAARGPAALPPSNVHSAGEATEIDHSTTAYMTTREGITADPSSTVNLLRDDALMASTAQSRSSLSEQSSIVNAGMVDVRPPPYTDRSDQSLTVSQSQSAFVSSGSEKRSRVVLRPTDAE